MAGRRFWVLLLLLESIQGHQDVRLQHNKTQDAVEGQNVTLPCDIFGPANLQLVSVEWGRQRGGGATDKLALFSPGRGEHLFRSNVSIQVGNNGAALLLPRLRGRDSGVYVCDITTFPFGAMRMETLLTVRGHVIASSQNPNLSTASSLMTSSTGDSVTSSTGDSVTSSTGDSGTSSTGDSVTSSTGDSVTSSTGDSVTSSTGDSVTSPTGRRGLTSEDRTSPSRTSRVPEDQSTQQIGNWSQRLTTMSSEDTTSSEDITSSEDTAQSSESRTSGQTTGTSGEENPTLRTRNNTGVYEDNVNKDKGSKNLFLWWIVVPVLLSILLLGLYCWRRSLKNRMDLPPSFKPPPPPLRYQGVSQQPN